MKQLKYIFLSLLVIGSAATFAQDGAKRKKIKVNRDVMMADELVKSGSYYNAIDIYLQEFNEDADPYVAYHLADAYFKARDYKNAEPWFKKAFEMDKDNYPQAQYYYALSMKYNAKYQEAIDEFKAFNKSRMWGSEGAYYKRLAKNELKGCDLALVLLEEPV